MADVKKIATRDSYGNTLKELAAEGHDDLVYASDDLAIPHIDMENRYFVLKPLSELAPNFRHPITHKTVTQMLSELPVDLTEGNEA